MNRSFEVRAARKLDVFHFAQDRLRLGALAQRQRDDLGALAGDVPGRDDSGQCQIGNDPDRGLR